MLAYMHKNEIQYGSHIVLGTFEQLGMRPKCDPTICTAPIHVSGRVSLAWIFPAMGTKSLGTVGH